MVAAATIVVIIIVWSAFSAPLDRRGITSALFFTVAGFVVGASALGWLDVSVESAVAERVTEIALVLLLFSDAARLDLRSLRRELSWPSRLLLIGLPLTMIAGVGVGWLVFPGMALASVVLLSTMLASTDAALGQRSSPTRRCRLACGRRSTSRAGSTTASRCRSSSSRSTSPTPSSRRASPRRSSATPPPRSAGGSPAGSSPGSSGDCCSVSPTAASGSAANGGRSCPWRWRSWPTPWRSRSAAAASSPPSSGAWRSAGPPGRAAPSSRCSRRRPADLSPPSPGSGSERWRSRWRSRTSPGRSSCTRLSA